MSAADTEASTNLVSGFSLTATVVRGRLLDRLDNLRPLTTVCAPAGYGKTTLLDSWTQRRHPQLAIVRSVLEEDHIDLEGFWSRAIDAFTTAGVDVDDVLKSREGPVAGRDAPPRCLARSLASTRRQVAWILDCGEVDLSPALGGALHRLLCRSEQNLALVLVTRSDPPLPLHAYRQHGRLTEIRAADLAFTGTEVAALLRRHTIQLGPVDQAALKARTGGWPAGLVFAAMSLRGRPDPGAAIRAFRGDTGNVAAFLMTEVLARQTPRMREFLLRSCVAEKLDPPLVQALTGQSCNLPLLEVLAEGNSFIEAVPGRRDQYRYHPLVQQFLRTRLAVEEPLLASELHRVAAGWLAEHGQTAAAVRQAVAARAWPLAMRLLVDGGRYATVVLDRDSATLRKLLAELPSDARGAHAAIIRAAMSLSELDADAAASHLSLARSALVAESPACVAACRLPMAILDAALWSLGSDTPTALRAVLFAEQVLGECPPPDITSHRRLLVIIAGCKGRLLLERGDLSAASTALADGIRAAREGHFDGAFRELTGMRALVEAIVGRLRRASELALGVEPVAGSTSGGNTVRGSEAASLALAWIRTDESRAREAQDLLNRAQAQEVSYDSRVLRSILVILRARSLCTRGELDIALADLRAERSAHPAEVTTAPTTGWLQSALLVAEAQVLTSLGQPDDAATLLRDSRHRDDVASEVALQRALLTSPGAEPDMTRLLGLCREEAPLSTRIERSLLLAETLLAEKDQAGAEQFLAQALRLGADELLRRPFREAGPRVTGLLLDSVTARRSRWLHTSRDTPPQGPTLVRTPNQERNPAEKVRVAAPMVDSLTTKEGEVLGHLAELLTTEEIAAAMFVSVNTVRTHVRSILRKLAVMRRNDAVRRAWDLGLLVRVDESDYRSAR